jgi:hypothetical protein
MHRVLELSRFFANKHARGDDILNYIAMITSAIFRFIIEDNTVTLFWDLAFRVKCLGNTRWGMPHAPALQMSGMTSCPS